MMHSQHLPNISNVIKLIPDKLILKMTKNHMNQFLLKVWNFQDWSLI